MSVMGDGKEREIQQVYQCMYEDVFEVHRATEFEMVIP